MTGLTHFAGTAAVVASLLLGHEVVVGQRLSLPPPISEGSMSVEEAISSRRSVRDYARDPLSLETVSQLLWAAQGETRRQRRSAPSAGALFPLEIYLVAGEVSELPPGVYRFEPQGHALIAVAPGDRRTALAAAALKQTWVRKAPAVLVLTAVYQRTTKKYGSRGRRYVVMEVGHAAENVYLQASALGLGTVMVGAFKDEEVQSVLDLPDDHKPLGLMPVGRR
ncbi:MAG: SagB/ThcOx family dehydrogenase [Xanthomonadales bacterium]|nr:SagB/ThcOx family dehydrogenase [Xanthomonadales bacterium]